MEIFVWNDSYSVNNERLDWQHKKLIDMMNEFYDNIKQKMPKDSIAILLKRMKEYIMVHFKTEEEYMRKMGYPRLEMHKDEHKKFVKKVEDLEEKFNSSQMILPVEVTAFLKNWLQDHILRKDKHFAKFLEE